MPKPPATPSAATASRVTTPWRASSCCASAAAHLVVSRARPLAAIVPLRALALRRGTSVQRPSADGGARRRDRNGADLGLAALHAPPRRARAGERAQRVKRVVGDQPLPDQVPQRVDRLRRVAAADRVVQRPEERRAAVAQQLEDRRLAFREVVVRPAAGLSPDRLRRQQPRQMIGEVQRDAAVALAERLDADPDDFAGRRDRVEIGRIVAVDPRRQDLGLEDRRRQRRALQLLDRVEQRVGAAPPPDDPLPRRREPAEHRLIDRLDLVAQLGERAAPQHAQHAGVGPLAPRAAGTELALDQASFGGEPHQHRFGGRHAEAVARREVRRR